MGRQTMVVLQGYMAVDTSLVVEGGALLMQWLLRAGG